MIITGGPVFWILIVMAVVALITYLERFFDLRHAQVDYNDFLKGVCNILDSGNIDEALAVCDDLQAPVAKVVETAIRNREGSARVLRDAVDSQGRAEVGRLDRRLASLAIIGQVAPMIGLLGTVIGFVKTVIVLGSQEAVTRAALASGMMEALVSAALGLAVAVPVVVMYGSLRVRLDRIVVDLEAAASQIVGYISMQKEHAK